MIKCINISMNNRHWGNPGNLLEDRNVPVGFNS